LRIQRICSLFLNGGFKYLLELKGNKYHVLMVLANKDVDILFLVNIFFKAELIMDKLMNEFEYYLEHQEELVNLYHGKFIVISNSKVVGVYDDELEAIRETEKTLELGTFLVQLCESGQDNYSQTFHSRVL
jgi:hypothetical protein